METEQIKSAINFSISLENGNRESFQNLLKLLSKFGIIFKEETAKLPYHINLIDELHADENAHSRIFAKLLRYRENNKFPILEQLLQEVCEFNLCIERPIIKKVDSCGRIDIPIFDNKYVVLIENKVTDKALDQNKSSGGQLARYIESIINTYTRKPEEIYVIYTPKYTREPSDESWINKDKISYKDDFKSRFRSLSYRYEIYPFIKNKLLPNVDKTNIYLYSAIAQYIDYLEGMFSLRTIDKPMNMKLQEFLQNELGIQEDNPEDATIILSEKEEELNNAISQIQLLKSKFQKQIVENHFVKWEKLLKEEFSDLIIVGDKFNLDKNIINLGIKFSLENRDYVAIIECNDSDTSNFYLGIGRPIASNKKFETSETLQKILNDNELSMPEDLWYGWKYTSLENAYSDLKILINQIKSK